MGSVARLCNTGGNSQEKTITERGRPGLGLNVTKLRWDLAYLET